MLSGSIALLGKDLVRNIRSPLFMIIAMGLPLVFVALYGLVVQVSATVPVAVARSSHGPHSDTFLSLLQEMSSEDGPYFRLLTTDPNDARDLYMENKVGAMLEIPESFDQLLTRGEPAFVNLNIYNINSDTTKNMQLRLDHAIYLFQAEYPNWPNVRIVEAATFQDDLSIKKYLAAALLMFSVLLSATLLTGSLITSEWEDRTAKFVVLSPNGLAPFVLGKCLGALMMTSVSTLLVLGIVHHALDFHIHALGWLDLLILLCLFLYGASLGAILGVTFQKGLPMVPIAVVVAITHFFVGGYESYVRGFAHEGAIEWIWRLSSWWPVTYLTEALRPRGQGEALSGSIWFQMLVLLLVATGFTLLAIRLLKRQLSFRQAQ